MPIKIEAATRLQTISDTMIVQHFVDIPNVEIVVRQRKMNVRSSAVFLKNHNAL